MCEKTCNICKLNKEISCFHPRPGILDGYRPYCKTCYTDLRKANRWSREKLNAHCKAYNAMRRASDPNFKLAANLRSRLCAAVNGNYKAGSAVHDLGCSIEEFKKYLESKFQEGMSWENYGRNGWHIDHKFPLSKVDLSNPEEFKKAVHYTNLQPLWSKDNIIKRNSI